MIDCTYLNERKWSVLLGNDNSPFQMSQVTIHIRNMDLLSKNEISRFFDYASDTRLARRNRMLFSMTGDAPETRVLINSLLNRLSCLHLALVPLRERMEDLSSISMLYINQMNLLLGKQLVGLDSDALELLKSYSWPGNLDQFRLVMRELS